MELEHRIRRLERQNVLLKVIACPIIIFAFIGVMMGAASFNQDRGELVKITKIQMVNAKGEEVAIIDANGIKYNNKESQLVANRIIGRASVSANPQPENSKKYVQLGVDDDGRKCYLDMGIKGHTRFLVLSDDGVSNGNFN